jgi:hypothetical protein
MTTIESGFVIPSAQDKTGLVNRLRSLAVGQSLHLVGLTTQDVKGAVKYAKKGGLWFASRTLTTGVRIWRTE